MGVWLLKFSIFFVNKMLSSNVNKNCLISTRYPDNEVLISDWPLLTDADQERLEEAITLSESFKWKLNVFTSGLLPEKDRWLQKAAHRAYDSLSKRELQVFKLRCKLITFPLIADQLDISTSSAKTYWRRSLAKCMALWESSDPLIDEEE